jgi:hypothetical protein
MKQDRVVTPGEYKAQHLSRTGRLGQVAFEKSLPGAERLWELLDRNISLSVWEKVN